MTSTAQRSGARSSRRYISQALAGGTAAITIALVSGAPAFAASETLPENPALPVVTFTGEGIGGTTRFVQSTSLSAHYGIVPGATTSQYVRTVATDANGATSDIVKTRSQTGTDGQSFSGGAQATVTYPATEGRYDLRGYVVDGDPATERSASSTNTAVLWIDNTAPVPATFNISDGFTTSDRKFNPPVNYEALSPEMWADANPNDILDMMRITYSFTGDNGVSTGPLGGYGRDNSGVFQPVVNGSGSPDGWLPGDYTMTVKVTDPAGNKSAESSVDFTITDAPAVAPVITSPEDGDKTADATTTIAGSGQTGAEITVLEGADSLCTATVVDSVWSCDAHELEIGDHTIVASQDDGVTKDISLLATQESAPITFTVTAAAVVEPVAISSPTNGSTVTPRPTFAGSGEAGATVTLSAGSTAGTATVDDDGKWAISLDADLAPGIYTYTVTQDIDGSTAGVTITVASPVVAKGNLASTGFDGVLSTTLLASGLLTAAAVALVARRRMTN